MRIFFTFIAAFFLTISQAWSYGASKNIVIMATGGTIAGKGKSSSQSQYSPSEVMVNDLIASVPDLKKIANISGEQFSQISSQNMNSEFWLKLSKRVNEILSQSNVDGLVITHGTDTLEETAYFLNLTVRNKKPVVIVGAMRPATSISADGPMNLFNAVAVAADSHFRNQGVMVVANDNIYAARDVSKTNTTNVATFQSNNFGPIGKVYYGKANLYYSSTRAHTAGTIFNVKKLTTLPRVDILYGYTNSSGDIIDAAVKGGAKGIVYASVGDGNAYSESLESLINASKTGVFVVKSARAGSGSVVLNSEINDDEYKFIGADNLNPQKARILLMLALTKTKNHKDIQEMFSTYY